MQFMMRSVESSSMGTVTNLDWPTRMTEAMMSIAYAIVNVRQLLARISQDTNLSAESVTFPLIAPNLRVPQDELGQCGCEDGTGEEVAAKDESWACTVRYGSRGVAEAYIPLSGGFAAAFTASKRALEALVNAVSVA